MKIFFAMVPLLLLGAQAMAADRVVTCRIDSNNVPAYKGKCRFSAEANGSFSLSNPVKDAPLYDEIEIVSVDIVDKGIAEVRGLTSEGIDSRWGEAKRSAKEKACWVGSDFKICAW